MIKNIIGGIAIGVANIIPGVSGGTIMVLLGMFDEMMIAISNLFKFKISFKERMKNFHYLFIIGIGVLIGLIGFAKILEVLFAKFSHQTLCLFAGLILLSLPMVKKQELKKEKISLPFFGIGLLMILALALFSQGKTEMIVSLNELININISYIYAITLILVGIISGASMLFPGISGSMVLLVIGYYGLYKSYVANVTSFEPNILIALFFIAIGVMIGIVISAKLTTYLLKKYKTNTMSFILGLILMSGIIIIPLSGYTLSITISSIICFIIGGGIVVLFERVKK